MNSVLRFGGNPAYFVTNDWRRGRSAFVLPPTLCAGKLVEANGRPPDASAKSDRVRRKNLRVKQSLQVIIQFAEAILKEVGKLEREFPSPLLDHLAAASIELELCFGHMKKQTRVESHAEVPPNNGSTI